MLGEKKTAAVSAAAAAKWQLGDENQVVKGLGSRLDRLCCECMLHSDRGNAGSTGSTCSLKGLRMALISVFVWYNVAARDVTHDLELMVSDCEAAAIYSFHYCVVLHCNPELKWKKSMWCSHIIKAHIYHRSLPTTKSFALSPCVRTCPRLYVHR